jgi:hypothetical protein
VSGDMRKAAGFSHKISSVGRSGGTDAQKDSLLYYYSLIRIWRKHISMLQTQRFSVQVLLALAFITLPNQLSKLRRSLALS